jgi:hypothetical protein
MGRPTKLTKELQVKIVEAIEAGNYQEVAAQSVGICRTTYFDWMKKGKEQKTGIYVDFSDAIQKARASAEMSCVSIIQAASHDSWQAAAWWLERTSPDRWGRTQREVERRIAELLKAVEELKASGYKPALQVAT